MPRICLSEICEELESGGRPNGGATDQKSGVFSFGGEHVQEDGTINILPRRYVPMEYFRGMHRGRLKQHDILIVKDGATTGKVGFFDIPAFQAASVNEHVFRLSVKREIADPHYVFFYLISSYGNRQILKDFRGATVGGISQGFTDFVYLPLPSLAKQKRIAGILAEADRLRRARRYALEISETFLRAVFLNLFGDPRSNPNKHSCVPAAELFEIQLGKMLDEKRRTGKDLRPYLGNANVQWGRFKLEEVKQMDFPGDEFERYKLKTGDVLVCEGGEIGRTAIWRGEIEDCCYQKALHRLRPISTKILSDYFQHFMWLAAVSGMLDRHSATSTITHFTGEKFAAFPVLLPPIELQRRFVALVDRHKRLQSKHREALRQADHFFSSLLKSTFDESLPNPE